MMTVIDIAGTMKELVKWALLEVVYFIAVILFALIAPFALSIGALYFVWQYPHSAATMALVYLFVGPFACALWMLPVGRWNDVVANWRAAKLGYRIEVTFRERAHRTVRGLGWMFLGFCGSVLAEAALTIAAHNYNVIPHHLILFFTVAPFAVFAPCWLVILSRQIRKPEQEDGYAVA